MVPQHVVDAGKVAGVLLDALSVVEAGRVDYALEKKRSRCHSYVILQ